MAEVEEMEDMTGIKGMKNDVRKKGEHLYSAGYMRLNWVRDIKAREN